MTGTDEAVVVALAGSPVRRPTLGLALIGAGGMGTLHAEHARAGHGSFSVEMIADPDRTARERTAEELGTQSCVDWQDALTAPNVDAVLLCSASEAHADQVVAAAEAGKHIFCEKPLALTVEDCDRAIDAAARAGVVLQVGFNRRFDASVAALAAELRGGRLGHIVLGRITSRDPEPPPPVHRRSPEGLFVESAIHDFDMARFLLGEEPVELTSYAGALFDPLARDGGDNDTAVTIMRFASGTLFTIENCRKSAAGYDQRIEVHGTEGSARTENVRPLAITFEGPYGATSSPGAWFYPERYRASYAAELDSFRDAIEGDPVAVTGTDGRAALALALAAARSASSGQPARLDID